MNMMYTETFITLIENMRANIDSFENSLIEGSDEGIKKCYGIIDLMKNKVVDCEYYFTRFERDLRVEEHTINDYSGLEEKVKLLEEQLKNKN